MNEAKLRAEFVRRVQRRMRALDMTQADFADGIGSARSAVSELLAPSSTVWPAAQKVMLMPKVLRCNGHWLMTGEGTETLPEAGLDERYAVGYLDAIMDVEQLMGPLAAEVRKRLAGKVPRPATDRAQQAREGRGVARRAEHKRAD